MLTGLKELEGALKKLNTPFFITIGEAPDQIPALASALNCSAVVTDYSPLIDSRTAKQEVGEALEAEVDLFEVDAHNIVPVWLASTKQEWSAATFRRKINGYLSEFLVDYPKLIKQDAELITLITEPFNQNAISSGSGTLSLSLSLSLS